MYLYNTDEFKAHLHALFISFSKQADVMVTIDYISNIHFSHSFFSHYFQNILSPLRNCKAKGIS